MATLEELVVRIKADASQLEREMKKAQGVVQQSTNGMKSGLSGVASSFKAMIPAIAVGSLVAFTKKSIDAADALNDLSQRSGVSVETLSSLQLAAKQADVSMQELGQALNFMNRNLESTPQAFEQLGLSVQALRGMNTEEQFLQVAQAISELGTTSERTKALMDVFGRSGANLSILMKDGAAGIREAMEEAKRLGLVLSTEEAARMGEFNDVMDKMAIVAERFGQTIALTVIPPLTDLITGIDQLLSRATNTSKFFNELSAGMLGAANAVGLVDDATLEEALLQASENMQSGQKSQSGGAGGVSSGRKPLKLTVGRGASKEAGEIDRAKKALQDYNEQLRRQHEFAMMAPADAAAKKVYYDTLELAQKAGAKNAQELALANEEVARSNQKMQDAMQESARFAAELKDQFAQTAGDIIFNSKSAGDALGGLAQSLAKMISQKYVLGPLSDNLFGSPGGGDGGLFGGLLGGIFGGGQSPDFIGPPQPGIFSGLGAMLGFADGGNPPVGIPSVVGEKGPELFVPKVSGTIIPNSAMGGTSVTVVQNNTFGSGVTRAEVANMLPQVAEAAKNAVFTEINRGGSAARTSGRR